MMNKTVCMVAGEASADRHAAAVIRALKETVPGVEVFGIGGPEMRSAGMECIYGIEEFSVMGFSDVLPRINRIFSVYNGLLRDIKERKPGLVMPVDLPDFNMRLAKAAKRTGAKVLYYIAPQAWAWRRYRARSLAKITDGLAVIFPFEEEFFSSYGVNARYVGHPFMEHPSEKGGQASWPPRNIVLMPGSRKHEVRTILPVMCEAKAAIQKRHPEVQWHLQVAPGIDQEDIRSMTGGDIRLSAEPPSADLAMVKSGTSSFEMAVLGIPEVICYRTSNLNYRLAKAFVKVHSIGMPNIILGRAAVPELIQDAFTGEALAAEILTLIDDEHRYREMTSAFEEMRARLGTSRPSRGVTAWIQSLID